jgi:hypothetical protein
VIHSILRDKATRLYIILGGFFVANALIAEMIGVKLFQLETVLGCPKPTSRCWARIICRSF